MLKFIFLNLLMRKLILFSVFFFPFSLICQSSKLKAYLDTKQFYDYQIGNYIEVYLQFVGPSVNFTPVNDGIQGKIEISFNIIENGVKIRNDAYILTSPIAKDSIQDDFYEVKRFALPPGKYTLQIELTDLGSKSKVNAEKDIQVEDFSRKPKLSDIEIAEYAFKSELESNFQKSGIHIVPLISNFFPTEINRVPIYFEVYNSQISTDSIAGILYKIINTETGVELEDFTSVSRFSTGTIIPIFKMIDIEKVPTGSFRLELNLINPKMDILAQSIYSFDRYNEILETFNTENLIIDPSFQASINEDSVFYFLASLIPIARPAEIKNIISTLSSKNSEKSRKHIQAFWKESAPTNSYEAWIKYKIQVVFVERLYGNNFQDGHETDRGRVYLKYGTPSTHIVKENSPSEYPYEIWTYDKIGKYSNRRFIFYNPDLTNGAYRLLHSDLLGELKNAAWSQILSKRNTNNGDIDDPNKFNQKSWGANSGDLFRQY
jgi:GWxTD domain-containing protein